MMVWHWIFSITAGGLAGWSLVRWSNPEGGQPVQGDLLRGVLALAAIIGFTYNGWMIGPATGLATLVACALAAALAYGAGRLRLVQLRTQPAGDAEESDAPTTEAEE